jgi:16S rRNA (uracil1498-N3)-methyltransferase
MQRFFVPPEILCSTPLILSGALAQQLSRVLRFRGGEHIILLDNSGWAYEVELQTVSLAQATARLVSKTQPQTEPSLRLVLCQALTREKKLDWVLQKGTELGVTAFQPLLTARSIVSNREATDVGKFARWRRIVTEAAEQSGRSHLPEVRPVRPFSQVCEAAPPGTLSLIAWVSMDALPLGQVLRAQTCTPQEVRLHIGPEGDFTAEEVALARRVGMIPISLGPRVLRTETAGMVALAAILYALGDLG